MTFNLRRAVSVVLLALMLGTWSIIDWENGGCEAAIVTEK